MEISDLGIKIITDSEGFRSKPYLDTGNVPTIGYGSTYYEDSSRVTMDDAEIDKERAIQLLKNHIKTVEKTVLNSVKVPTNQNQFDALVCFVYNIGAGNFNASTMLKLINASNYDEAAKQFPRWNKDNGKVLSGLVKRRQSEMDLFLTK